MEVFLTLYEYKPAKSIGGNPSFMAAGIADPPWGYGLSEGRLSSTRTPTPAYPTRNPAQVSKPLTITSRQAFHSVPRHLEGPGNEARHGLASLQGEGCA